MKNVLKLMLMLGVGVSAVAAEQVPVEVQQVIDSAMAGKIPIMADFNSSYAQFGYKLSEMQAGEPIHLYQFNYDLIKNTDVNAPVSSVIRPINEWAVPLLLHGKSQILLEIIKNTNKGGKWHVMGYGMSGYAERWEKICQIWPESKGYHPEFIGQFLGMDFYFHIPEKGDYNLTRFVHYGPNRDKLDSLIGNLEHSSIALEKIKSRLTAHSAGGR